MDQTYFNFYSHLNADPAVSPWDLSRFVHGWWRIYAADPRWVPPYYPDLRTQLQARHNPHLARMQPMLLHLEAMARRRRPKREDRAVVTSIAMNAAIGDAIFEVPVGAAVALCDPRRQDATGYLALLHATNSRQCLERLTQQFLEPLAARGVRRLIGPTGLSPYLGSGVLEDAFDRSPPLHTAYNPPYLPEIMGSVWRPLTRLRLHCAEVSAVAAGPALSPPLAKRVTLAPFDPNRLKTDLLPLFQTAAVAWRGVPTLDDLEADFLLTWLAPWPLLGRLLLADEEPAGFILMQPDMGHQLHWAKGGRAIWRRVWLRWRKNRPAQAGRLLFGGVLPTHRNQGLGRFLWQTALGLAREQGWQRVTVGPVPAVSAVSDRLVKWGAEVCRTYMMHQIEL